MLKSSIKNHSGQSLIEFLILSVTLIILIKGLILFFWLGVSILWMDHQLYQGVVCAAQQKNMILCKEEIIRRIKKLNPVGSIQALKIKHFGKEWKGEITWTFYKKDFFIRQNLSLP